MHIGLISAAFPPDLDGIGDYTWWLAKTLVEQGCRVTVFTRGGNCSEVPGGLVNGFYDPARPRSFGDLVQLLEDGEAPDWVVLQYNPFSWGARGFCPEVARTWSRLRSDKGEDRVRLAVMFHETMVPRWPWKFTVMRTWQSRFFQQVCTASDRIFVSSGRWLTQVTATQAKGRASILPVGSNIPVSPISREEARDRWQISQGTMVAGIFGGAHGSRRIDWIAEAAKRYLAQAGERELLVLHVGPDEAAIGRVLEGIPFRSLGVRSPDQVAEALRAMDCLMSPFVDGISARRTSAIAPLLNGVPVATTVRGWSDAVFRTADERALLLSQAQDGEGFARDFLAWLPGVGAAGGEAAQAFALREFSWEGICRTLLMELESTNFK